MAKKKKEAPKNEAPKEKETTLGDIVKKADRAIVVTVSNGQVEVTGIKNINYAFDAKAMMIAAIDNYDARPIINGLNNNTRALLSHIMNITNKITKLVPDEIPEPPKEEKKA